MIGCLYFQHLKILKVEDAVGKVLEASLAEIQRNQVLQRPDPLRQLLQLVLAQRQLLQLGEILDGRGELGEFIFGEIEEGEFGEILKALR